MMFHLTEADRAHLAPILERLSEVARSPMTLEYLLERWLLFVSEVGRGYRYTIDDYTNDVSVRDLLEEIMRDVPGPLREKIYDQVKLLDKRFYESTRPVARPLQPPLAVFYPQLKENPGLWWFRVPEKVDGELEKDLRSEGLL